ncbi:MAG: EscU/YscU/HrcU family type III secretion system export apparatus switch protein [Myxococcota bacterium]
MAAEQDGQEKTFEPTPQREEEFRREGRVVKSKDVTSAVQLLMALLAFNIFGMAMFRAILAGTRWTIQRAAGGGARPTITDTLYQVLGAVVPPALTTALLMAAAAVLATLAQTRFNWAPSALKPKFDRVNPLNGIKQTFSPKKFGVNIGLSTLKIGAAAFVVGVLVAGVIPAMAELSVSPLSTAIALVTDHLQTLLLATTLAVSAMAALDYAWQRYQMKEQMKMTRQEFQRSTEEQEGKPIFKQRRRQMHKDLSFNRIMQALPEADVVVTNPTHLAVVLRYRPGEDKAPKVTAKGADELARHIRALARRHAVPIVENRPIARTLWRRCKPGQSIPSSMYESVAKVLARVYRKRAERGLSRHRR